jgi:hypothetical protein
VIFSRKKRALKNQRPQDVDPSRDEGIIGLYFSILGQIEEGFATAVADHLHRVHQPGGYAREKREHDFMDLGMKKTYIDGLDDMELTVEDAVTSPQLGIRAGGQAVVVSRWTVHGVHNRPFAGIAPSGQQVTIQGITYTTFRNYNIRVEYTYWQLPEFTRRMTQR